jgi:hypothetical protein
LPVTASTPDVISTASVLTRLTAALASAFVDGEQPAPLFTGALPYTGPVDRRARLTGPSRSVARRCAP